MKQYNLEPERDYNQWESACGDDDHGNRHYILLAKFIRLQIYLFQHYQYFLLLYQ